MKCMEFVGKTIDEAKKNALSELGVDENRVQIQVIDEGSKGILSFIRKRPAKISVTVSKDYCEEARAFLSSILENMKIEAEIDINENNNVLKIELKGSSMGILIGYRGETLDSIQYLVNLVVNKGQDGQYKRVVLDAENYRDKREETLKRLAVRMSHRVEKTGKLMRLEPMNPYERRIIHSALQSDKYVRTYSEGDEPRRYVVIDLKKA
ncbi:RNA-binding cell elongation regulator Jag/EloR [Clostridium akagii]|uniref:RNA-binding cell elongation regulator Jag/EloR n=1 Tax=Clostridium akagii TaxID=91623 RepID=UPI00047EF719|nr:RNA-binding cell elongation regulator Jag/EloR [Clostridium akagii]